MLSSHSLTVHPRPKVGSRYAQRERAAGRLPAVVYGHGRDPLSVSLDARQALRFFHAGEKVFTVDIPGEEKGQTVILKELQFDYLGTNVVHVDMPPLRQRGPTGLATPARALTPRHGAV